MPTGVYPRIYFLTAEDYVCMNPQAKCSACIFNKGSIAKWCPSAERKAKAERDTCRNSEEDAA